MTKRSQPIRKSIKVTFIENGFAAADLQPATLVPIIKNKKNNHINTPIKTVDWIKELMDERLHIFYNNKTNAQMWTILQSCF